MEVVVHHLLFDAAGAAGGACARGVCRHRWHRALIAAAWSMLSTLLLLALLERVDAVSYLEHLSFDAAGAFVGYSCRSLPVSARWRLGLGVCGTVATTSLLVWLVG